MCVCVCVCVCARVCVCVCVCARARGLHLQDGRLGRASPRLCHSVPPLISSSFFESVEGNASLLFCFDWVTRADWREALLDDD